MVKYKFFIQHLKTIKNNNCNEVEDAEKIKLSPEDTTNLMEKLNDNYLFIIINDALHKKICKLKDQNTHQIKYLISPAKIIIYTENDEELHFKNYENNRINKYSLINSDINFNNVNNSSLINRQTFKKEDESNLDFYLLFVIQLNKEKNNFKRIIGQSFVSNSQKQNEYYLMNKNYIKEINQIFKSINQIIEQYQEKNESDLIKIIKTKLDDKKINSINKLKIQKQLDNKEISELKFSYAHNDKDKALCFYQNFDIISKKC